MVALDVGLRSNIQIAMSHRVTPTDTMRVIQTKTISIMAPIGVMEVEAKTELRGGHPRNNRKGDQ